MNDIINSCRYLGTMKSYVRNKARPEGCIAECYIADETMYFISRYFDDTRTHWRHPPRVDDRPEESTEDLSALVSPIGRGVGQGRRVRLSELEILQAHRHVLTNTVEVDPFLR